MLRDGEESMVARVRSHFAQRVMLSTEREREAFLTTRKRRPTTARTEAGFATSTETVRRRVVADLCSDRVRYFVKLGILSFCRLTRLTATVWWRWTVVHIAIVGMQEASAEDDGVDNDADIESLDSDDGYESTEDVLYKPPPSGYSFSDSSSEEELVGAGKKGKNNGKKKSKVSKPVNGPVGKGNGKPKRAAIGREEVAGASVQRKSHGGPVKKKAKLQAAKEANESEKAKGVMETNEAHPEGEKNNEGHITNEVEAQANAAENAKCGNEGEKNGETDKHDCPWLIYCAKNSRSGGYQIKTYNPTHTCGREFGSNMADQHWVARKLEKRLLSQPRLTHAEAWDHMKVDYNVILNDKMLYRGLRMARKKYVGNEKAQHGKLRDYLNEIHRYEPEAPTNHTVPDIGMNVNAATGRQIQPQQPSRRPKQTIIRSKRQESVSVETMAAASSGTTSRIFKFIPTPGLNHSKKK
ncbi:hypothetical protein Ahy_A07g032502 isoform F [Arachis hypogaea]|uniref:Transposase MuDR plant domain-containing protein n=1 Tax=Arachis hypogaea TaxID=3818 RepID=A0A445C715_ARAHY|nr:hypothetical protein Ahy_A07g032502 isoform F [Arachis hypogaea]